MKSEFVVGNCEGGIEESAQYCFARALRTSFIYQKANRVIGVNELYVRCFLLSDQKL